MTESCLLDTVETALQTNLKALDAKCKSVQGGLQADIMKGFQDIGTQISQMGKGLLGAKSQATQTTDPQAYDPKPEEIKIPTNEDPKLLPHATATHSAEPDQHPSDAEGVYPDGYPPASEHAPSETPDHHLPEMHDII